MDPLFPQLIEAYLTDSLTIEQEIAFIKMLEEPGNRNILDKAIEERANDQSLRKVLGEDRMEKSLSRLKERLGQLSGDFDATPVHRLHFMRKWGWAAASVILMLLAGTAIWIKDRGKTRMEAGATSAVTDQRDIRPGQDGAILKLEDGSVITLDSMSNGLIAKQNGANVTLQNGELAYNPTSEKVSRQSWNTMYTPNGRQFRLVLPDGSKVWLNAGSSIRYPTSFNSSERSVEVTGELYFEVAKNDIPFKVNVNNEAEVRVLGTHFNINAYNDEPSIKTTLLEGSIKMSKNNASVILQPGQQAIVTQRISVKSAVDVKQVVSWKNGAFDFSDATIKDIMRQLSRWYDVGVIYAGEIQNEKFAGQMGRNLNLSEALSALKDVGINSRLEGRNIVVYGNSQP